MKRPESWYNGKKDWKSRKKKFCCCGGHNDSNVKSNLHHHGTFMKYLIRLSRRFKEEYRRAA